MALGTDEATFNAAVDTLIDAWVTLCNALSSDEEIRVIFVNPDKGNLSANTKQGTAAHIKSAKAYDFARQFYWKNNPDTAGSVPLSIGGTPLFFKITNANGDIS